MASDKDSRDRYEKDFPADKANLAKAWRLLESYSGIPKDEIESHAIAVREKAFAIFPYPCIGHWRFLDLYLTSTPEYPGVIARLQAGEKLLDVGCCFGQVLRELVLDGAPAANLVGTDLRPEFIDLGFDLFRDRASFAGRFVPGNALDPADAGLASLDGSFDIIHSASFFHLFGWDDQVRLGERLARFFRPGAKPLLFGRQVGNRNPPPLDEWHAAGAQGKYRHNPATLQALWDAIGERTGSRWKASSELIPSRFDAEPRDILLFNITRVE